MFKGTFSAASVAADTDIPITQLMNTNTKTGLSSTGSSVSIKSAGLWNVVGNIVCTASTTGTTSLQLYANGVAVPSAEYAMTVASGDEYTFTINDIVKTIKSSYPLTANVSMRFSDAVTIQSGDIIVTYLS